MFETRAELEGLQRLLDESFERSDNIRYSGFGPEHRLSAAQLAGFQGVRLMAVASVNSKGEPRAAPRSAAFLHGKFYLASNSKSTMARRLALHPALGFTYFESRLLIIGHGEPALLRRGTTAFKEASPQWVEAFRGGEDALEGMDLLLRLDADHLVAFAANPDRYPEGWRTTRSHHR